MRLKRKENLSRCGQRVQCQNAEGRGTVQDQKVKLFAIFVELVLQNNFSPDLTGEFQLSSRKIQMRRNDPKIFFDLITGFGEWPIRSEHAINTRFGIFRRDSEMQRSMCLRIKINEANPFTHSCKCSAQIDGRRRFADATFLIDGGNCSHGRKLPFPCVRSTSHCQLTMDHVWDYRQRRKNDARRIMVRGGFIRPPRPFLSNC